MEKQHLTTAISGLKLVFLLYLVKLFATVADAAIAKLGRRKYLL
jgi:hypothetical protein